MRECFMGNSDGVAGVLGCAFLEDTQYLPGVGWRAVFELFGGEALFPSMSMPCSCPRWAFTWARASPKRVWSSSGGLNMVA
jgi:hypothetical protein